MKEYVKPELYYESFELSQHIAGCNLTMTDADPMNCSASGMIGVDENQAWFIEGNMNCSFKLQGYCYTNSSINLATINS